MGDQIELLLAKTLAGGNLQLQRMLKRTISSFQITTLANLSQETGDIRHSGKEPALRRALTESRNSLRLLPTADKNLM